MVLGGAHFGTATQRGFLVIAQVLPMVLVVQVCRLQLRAWLAELQIEPVPFSPDLEGGTRGLENWESMFADLEGNLSFN